MAVPVVPVIVDGYNLLYARGEAPSAPARARLVRDLIQWADRRGRRAVVVFDAWAGGQRVEREEARGPVTVCFTRYGERADERIVRWVSTRPEAVVVTSDRAVQQAVQRRGAAVLSSEAFADRLDAVGDDRPSGGGVQGGTAGGTGRPDSHRPETSGRLDSWDSPPAGKSRRQSRQASWLRGLCVVLGLALAATASGAPSTPAPRLDPRTSQEVPTAVTRVSPAVVAIRSQVPPDRPSAATLGVERAGSGVIVDPEGLALTVGYLVLEASAIEIGLADGRTVTARVVGHDFESGLALLRLAPAGRYPAATLGRSDPVAVGQPVSVVGMNDQRRPVGISARVTGVRRFVAYWEYMLERAIFVAPQHPSFGGAALVDADGALLGVVSLRLERENLAIPIDLFAPVREALLTAGRPARPSRPWLGVRAVAVDGGVGIAGVSPSGPAQAAGLRHGDVIVRLNGERVADLEDFYRKLWRAAVGSPLELSVYRDGQLETVTVRPQDRYAVFRNRPPAP